MLDGVRTGEIIISRNEAARRLGISPKGVDILVDRLRLTAVCVTPVGTNPNRRLYGITANSVVEYLHLRATQTGKHSYIRDPAERARMYADGYITLVDAGKMLGMQPDQVGRYCKTGKLPLVKKKIRYTTREAVEQFRQERIAKHILALENDLEQLQAMALISLELES